MEKRILGNSGLRVSRLGLGTMTWGRDTDEHEAADQLKTFLDAGGNLIDTAAMYGDGDSERVIGGFIGTLAKREDLVIATKAGISFTAGERSVNNSRTNLLSDLDKSLSRLGVEYVDLWQIHTWDPMVPLEETLSTLNDLVRSGKVRYIGCSNFPAWLLMKSLWVSDANGYERFDSIQPHYSYVHRAEFERETQAVCADQGIGVIPYSPLAAGFLTGKYRRDTDIPDSVRADGVKSKYMNAQGFAAIDKLEEIGSAHNATVAQTAIAWILANPTVSSAIIGANNTDQLADTMKGADIELSADEKAALDEVTVWE